MRARELDTPLAEAAAQQARAALQAVRAQRWLVRQREREVQLARAQVEQAEASLRLARIARSHARLQAHLDGVVVSRTAPGTVVLTVADLARPYLRVFVPETEFGRVRMGQRAEVRVDAFPGRTFPAWVAEVSQQPEYTRCSSCQASSAR